MVADGDNNNKADDEEEDSEELKLNTNLKLRISVKTVITTETGTFRANSSRLFHFSDHKNKHIKL